MTQPITPRKLTPEDAVLLFDAITLVLEAFDEFERPIHGDAAEYLQPGTREALTELTLAYAHVAYGPEVALQMLLQTMAEDEEA